MAFKNGLSERLDELRFPSPRSPPSESAFPGYTSLSPGHSNLNSAISRPSGDVRANLQRRFTTDSSKFSSSWNYLSQPGQSGQDSSDLLSSFEKKRQHIEYMRETRRRFEQEMKAFDMEHEKEKKEMESLALSLAKTGISGHVSEPTTPPDDVQVPAQVSRPGRFSTSSVTSSPGFFNAFSTSSQFTSPQAPSTSARPSVDRFAGQSLPGSRRNSEKEDFKLEPPATLRPGATLHRYSLPSSNFTAPYGYGLNKSNSGYGIDSFAATKHLFNRDEDKSNTMKDEGRLSTPDITGFLKMTELDDKFPTLSRRDGSNVLSANPDARELANSRTPGPDGYHAYHNRTRSAHISAPQNTSSLVRLEQLGNPVHGTYGNGTQSRHLARHSLEGGYVYPTERQTEAMTPVASSRPTPLQSSYSTNDLPTVKGNGFDTAITSPKNHAEHFHQHNASLGRIPTSAMTRRSSKNSSDFENAGSNQYSQYSQTVLQASAAPFGPQLSSVAPNPGLSNALVPTGLPFSIYGYPIQPYLPQNSQMGSYGAPSNYGPPSTYGGAYRYNDSTSRAIVPRRQTEESAAQLIRYANYPLEHYKGELYSLCKDQHGCRYLQRKLEERNPEHIQLIFNETYMHVIELMTDPFGNYLCQKLFEYANDEQRTVLINNAAPSLRDIAVNQHGTRALQKMIECITTSEQIQTVVRALENHVVQLVQDLNGNHVIQKCLNHLKGEAADFIYEAVGANCMSVGTHRHGCCVIQRCIDHASGAQKDRLIAHIIENAYTLVQDPYGNYVVQYILDLGDPKLVPQICDQFKRNVASLSKQKFSSNVIEKCLRTANDYTRRLLIDEMLRGHELEKMLRDSYANYVVQTAMDHADPETRHLLVDRIRPILPSMRQTPHGRRIAGKIMAIESARRNSDPHKNNLQIPSSNLDADQVPKQLMQKPFMHHRSDPSNGFNRGLLPTPAASSSNSPPTGPADGSCHFNPSAPNASNEFGAAQNALYSYF